jgi:hypothetical protein
MKHKLVFLLLPILLYPILPANALDVGPFTVYSEINTYIETKIVVRYAFTQNVTSDAYSAGQSVWQVNIDPLITTFTTSAADRFTWHLTVTYSMMVDQTVTIAIFSGDEPVDSWSYLVRTDKIILNFDVTVTEQPHYPTAEELADMSIEVLSNRLAEYVAEMQTHNQVNSQNLATQWVVVLIVFAGWVIQTLLPYIKPPKRTEEH